MARKPTTVDDIAFLEIWNDTTEYPTIADVASELTCSRSRAKNRAMEIRRDIRNNVKKDLPFPVDRAAQLYDTPIPELHCKFMEEWTEDDCIQSLRQLAEKDLSRYITRIYYRTQTEISDSTWNRYFGTFHEFKRQANLALTRHQHAHEKHIARHVSVDHYRAFDDRHDLGTRYLKAAGKKHKTIIGASDLHDKEIDPFYLRTLIAAVRMVQPDIINLSGDIFDLPEFSRFTVDPREWDAAGRIKYVHDNILRPLRQAAPNAQIDFLEGNHEYRLLRHLADSSPAMRSILSDLHGMTVPQLLGLDRFEINYISKADLAAFNKADEKKEIGKSYIVYDEALLVHHHPHASSWGLPGWNGHNHKWLVSHHKNAIRGAYQWLQLGCGHRLNANYAEGEFWSLGFTICHLNSQSKSTTFEYVSVTDMAVVGGTFLYREPSEMVGAFAKQR